MLVASKIGSFQQVHIEWLAYTAALSTGISSGFDIGSKSNRMMRAWRMLNASIIEFEENEDITIDNVIKTYTEAEEIIGDVKEKPK